MGGVSFPCFSVKTTDMTSLALFTLLTRFTFTMLETALLHLGRLLNPRVDEADDQYYPTNYYVNYPAAATPAVQAETTLIKNSLPPVMEYGSFIRRFGVQEDDGETCALCLNTVEKSDEIRELNNCSHVFHRECLDTWINKDRITCPLCRSILY